MHGQHANLGWVGRKIGAQKKTLHLRYVGWRKPYPPSPPLGGTFLAEMVRRSRAAALQYIYMFLSYFTERPIFSDNFFVKKGKHTEIRQTLLLIVISFLLSQPPSSRFFPGATRPEGHSTRQELHFPK